jgi:ABC-type antimicrobial peptide transport system permease subunit
MLSRTTTRAREIAVRRALGASGSRLLRQLLTETAVLAMASAGLAMLFAAWTADALVVRHGLTLALTGIGIGLVSAAGFATLLRSMLYDVSPASPLTHTAVGLGLTLIAALAAYVPAQRAVRIDPARALASD